MPNIKLTIEYDGTKFAGWQFQENGRSVQAELERGLRQILQEEVRVHGAGRTDSGVHARGQVANFVCAKTVDPGLLRKAMNGLLPDDVVVVEVEEVPADFHARHSAVSRSYEYIIEQRPTALQRAYCWHNTYRLDADLLARCADSVLGKHDFSSFCKAGNDMDHYTCRVTQAAWSIHGTRYAFSITANRFLYGMVRAIVGTTVEIARGHRQATSLAEIMEEKNRSKSGMSAPAQGLFLTKVGY